MPPQLIEVSKTNEDIASEVTTPSKGVQDDMEMQREGRDECAPATPQTRQFSMVNSELNEEGYDSDGWKGLTYCEEALVEDNEEVLPSIQVHNPQKTKKQLRVKILMYHLSMRKISGR